MPQPDTIKVLLPGKLIDSVKDTVQEGMAVVVQGSIIRWVGRASEVGTADVGELARETLEFPGSTLLPGLVDMHTHTNRSGDGLTGDESHRLDNDEVRLLRSARNALVALESGVTTLCDCGSWNRTGFALKESLASGLIPGARALVAGPPLTVTGGHLWFMGGVADGVDQVRQAVRHRIMQGADFIKVAASGGSTASSDPYRASYSLEELRAIVDESHNRGLVVFAHCRCTDSVNRALDAGVDVIVHCFFYDSDGSYRYDERTAGRLAESESWVNPTISIGQTSIMSLTRVREERELSDEELAKLDRGTRTIENLMEEFGRLNEAGVKLIGGSDCGWGDYPFGDFQGEVLAMAEAGLSPIRAIQAGTRDAAAAVGLGASIGTVEAGKEADLLLVNGDPTGDLNRLRDVRAVFKGGRSVSLP